jgi:hypothetical protein
MLFETVQDFLFRYPKVSAERDISSRDVSFLFWILGLASLHISRLIGGLSGSHNYLKVQRSVFSSWTTQSEMMFNVKVR